MFVGIFNRVLLLILNFVLRTIMIRTIGVEYLGINGTLADVMSLLCMADLGFNTAIVYSFYEPLAKNDTKTIVALVYYYKKIYNIIAITIACGGICILPFLNIIVRTEKDVPYLSIYYLLTLANVVCSYLFVYKASILTADQKDYIRTQITMITNVIKIFLQIIFLLLLKSYMLYLVVTLLATIVSNVAAAFRADKDYLYLGQRYELGEKQKKDIFINIKSVFLYKVSSVVLNATDNTLISMLVGTIYVGYYSNYFLLMNSLSIILVIIFNSTTASIGNLVVTEEESARYSIFNYMQTFSFCLCCIVVPCYINLADDCIRVWLGTRYEIDTWSLVAITINFYLNSVFLPVVSYREAVGLYRQTRYVMLVTAGLNILLSIMLSLRLGMAGILLATPIARLVTYIWYEPKLLFKEYFGKSAESFFVKFFINNIIILLITWLSYRVTSMIQVNNWILWFFKACICAIISVAVMSFCYYRTEGYKWVIGQIFRIIRKRGI